MPRKFIDLSVALESDIASDPEIMLPQIDYYSHKETASQLTGFFPGLNESDLPNGEGWALEKLTIFDAPYHHHSTMSNGERAITIDEVPLEWCFGSGVKLDFRHLPDGHIVTPAEIDAELARINYSLSPMDIVLVNISYWLTHPPAIVTAMRITWSVDAVWVGTLPCTC